MICNAKKEPVAQALYSVVVDAGHKLITLRVCALHAEAWDRAGYQVKKLRSSHVSKE
jgi:hypothetical protein